MDIGLTFASLSCAAALFAVFFFCIAPMLIRAKFYQNASPSVYILDEAFTLPDNTSSFFDGASEDLALLGFEEIATLLIPDAAADSRAYCRVFVNRSTKDGATIVSCYTEIAGTAKVQDQNTEFTTLYQGGTLIMTNDLTTVVGFPTPAHATTINAPWIKDCDELYRAHRCISGWRSPGKAKIVRVDDMYDGDVVASLKAGMRDSLEDARAVGYLRFTEASEESGAPPNDDNPYASPSVSTLGGRYTLTMKGAYLMTWKLLWPVKPLYKQFVVWRGKRTLAQAGFYAARGGKRAVG